MKKLILCACRFYHRIPEETLQAVYASCVKAGVECGVVPDLCYLAAKDPEEMRKIAESEVVGACQTRVTRAFFANWESPKVLDLRTLSAADFLTEVGLKGTESGDAKMPVQELPQWVPWFPVIDTTRCVNCGKCADFCMFGVYAVDESRQVRVVHPDSCKTNCPACARICPQNAILFPKSEEPALNGSLEEIVKPPAEAGCSLKERLRERKAPRLFREDEA